MFLFWRSMYCNLCSSSVFSLIYFFHFNILHQGIDKIVALCGMALPVALSILPSMYLVYTGSIEKTAKLFGTPAMVGGLISSILWLVYSITVIKIGQSLGLLILHSFLSMSTFNYLMCVYADRKATTTVCFIQFNCPLSYKLLKVTVPAFLYL